MARERVELHLESRVPARKSPGREPQGATAGGSKHAERTPGAARTRLCALPNLSRPQGSRTRAPPCTPSSAPAWGGAEGGAGGGPGWAALGWAGRAAAAAAAGEKLSRPERALSRDPEPPRRHGGGRRDHRIRSRAGRFAAGGRPGAWDSRRRPRAGAAPWAGGGRPELPGRRMRSEGAAPGPVAPLCGALSLMLGALLGKGKAGRASVSPALRKFAGRVGPGPGEPEGGGVAGTLGRALVPPGMPAPGAERPFPSREDPVGRRVRGTWANSAGPKSPDSGCFPGAWGRGWGGHCRPHAEFRADLTQPQQSQCGVGEPASLPPFPPALRPQSPSQSDWDWRSRRADRQWGLEKRPWPREERVLTAQLAGPPREPRWGPVCLGRAERWWARGL